MTWQQAIQAAVWRRDFPSLMYATRWIYTIARAGWYPSGSGGFYYTRWRENKGE